MDPQPIEDTNPGPRPAVAWRNWRVVLDKVGIILALAALQTATEEWCLELASPQRVRSKTMDTMEDYYKEVILTAAPLKPLKSKEDPKQAISACVHLKEKLRGGGNGNSSYIVCRDCNARWAHTKRAAEVRQQLKHGPLNPKSSMEVNNPGKATASASDGRVPVEWMLQTPPRTQGRVPMESPGTAVSTSSTAQLEEFQEKMILMQQLEMRNQMLMAEMQNQQAVAMIQMSQAGASQAAQLSEEMNQAVNPVKEKQLQQDEFFQMILFLQGEKASSPSGSTASLPTSAETRLCKCKQPAERLQVKAERNPRKGRWFWKCIQRQCDHFEWEKMTDPTMKSPESVASSRTRREKSPRRTDSKESRRSKSPKQTETNWSVFTVPPMTKARPSRSPTRRRRSEDR